jgi:hypothetical protein
MKRVLTILTCSAALLGAIAMTQVSTSITGSGEPARGWSGHDADRPHEIIEQLTTRSEQPITAELIDQTLAVAYEIDPEIGNRLKAMCGDDPAEFERVLRTSGRRLVGLAELRDRAPELYDMKRREWRQEVLIDRTVRELAEARMEDDSLRVRMLENELRSHISIQVAMQIAVHGEYLRRLKEQMEALERDIDQQARRFEQTVEQRYRAVLDQLEPRARRGGDHAHAAPLAVPEGVDCDAPTGVDVSGAGLDAHTGATGFTTLATSSICDNSCGITNAITIGRNSAANLVGATPSTYHFSGIVNPSNTNETFFVRITTFTSLDGTGGDPNDAGTVAASTAEPIIISGDMPESLVFCTGRSIPEANDVPDCTNATAGDIGFNQLFTPELASWATSQMAASTNATSGYVITVHGPTMTSGGNTITPIGGTSTTSAPGTSQFGMNVVENNEPNNHDTPPTPFSANVTTPLGNSEHNGQAIAPYATGGNAATARFAFLSGDAVADSNGLGTDSQVLTVTYIVNVPGSQPAGTYTTTLTYIATAYF